MRIQHNIMAMNAYRNYNNNTAALSKNLEKLSSGYKINRAGDDAAGLAISEKMRAQITGLGAAQKNVKDGISLVKTGEGAMQEIQDMLNRMDYLATQSANGTYDNDVDRLNLQKEITALKTEINRIADSANFNGIKLLDGSLDKNMIPVDGTLVNGTAQMAKGIEFEIGQGGGGSKGTYSINITNPMGSGDTVSIQATKPDGTNLLGTKGLSLAYGTDFTGATADEQAQSIADKLMSNGSISGNFSVSVEGGTVTLTSLKEGDDQVTADFTVGPDKATTADTGWKATTVGASNKAGTAVEMADIFGISGSNNAGANLNIGDELTFEFKMTDAAGGITTRTATITVDEHIKNATTNAQVAERVAAKLKDANFDANPDTIVAEETMKVGDLFDVDGVANKGSLNFAAKAGAGQAESTVISLKGLKGVTAPTPITVGKGSSGTQNAYTIKLATAGAKDFTGGDKLTFKGTLGDGRTFEFTMEAGKDFDIDYATTNTNATQTMTNLKNKLESNDVEITLSDGTKVKAGDIFGANKEITLAATATGMTLTSNTRGASGEKGVTTIDEVKLDATASKVKDVEVNGSPQTGASSTVTFGNDMVEYGSVIEVDGVSFEIVKSANERTNYNNVAVEVDDVSDGSKVASAFAKAINGLPGNGNPDDTSGITATAKGNKVEITTNAIGSDQVSPVIATNGDTVKKIDFQLDPGKVQAGSKVTINGQTYEFTDGKKQVTEGNIAVKANLKDATVKTLADSLVSAVRANAKNTANISMDSEGTVTVKGTVNVDGEKQDPSVSFSDGKGGLNLQIGDTADSYNQMSVSIGDMHTTALGIDGINIGNQDDARAAIDVIKNAINYVSGVRGDLGAIQNRLDHTANNLSVMAENIQDAESTIRDTDVADEMMSYVKNNILVQSAQAMLAQANQVPQGVLQLLG